jgi:hypothetical protein
MDDIKLLLPGFFQGLTRVTISYPFDVVKVQMQKMLYKNNIDAVKDIVKTDKFKLYRGASISYLSVGIDRSIQFYLAEKLNKKYNSYINGIIISIIGSIINVPAQYLTTNIALFNNKSLSFINNIKNIYKSNNLYKGYFLEMGKNQLGSSIFMGTYYMLRNRYGDKTKYAPLYGALSGLSLWPFIYPIDTIRTEYQTSNNTIKDIIQQRYKQYGILSFYKGITPVLFRTIPSASLGMLVYEYVRSKVT